MPHTGNEDLWYAVYHVRDGKQYHNGSYHVEGSRDADGRRIQDHRFNLQGDGINHTAHCRLVLERRGGRFVPYRLEYNEPGKESGLTFADGRIQGTGEAKGHDGASVPDDAMPTYGVSILAQSIYNQPESSLSFDALVDATGGVCGADAKLVAHGKTNSTPYPSDVPLWEVVWLSNEGTRVQAFYFTDEGVLVQADWGATKALLVENAEQAAPIPTDSTTDSVEEQ